MSLCTKSAIISGYPTKICRQSSKLPNSTPGRLSHALSQRGPVFTSLKDGSGLLMFDAALAAASQILTPPFRTVLWKTLALTLALLGLVWIALHKLLVA